jgi:protein-L-isoaspartate(D-aspartate) O-methyltransferase
MPADPETERFAALRREMVESQLHARGLTDEGVLGAMARVPRHRFVAPEYQSQAYADHPLPIGHGQTISQPYIVGITLQALALGPDSTVLEIGTGSGYMTALLAELAGRVYSIERFEIFSRDAESILRDLGYSNVRMLVGDGSLGLPEYAPYDAIAAAAAAPRLPAQLFAQLREAGRLVIPVGPPRDQELQLVRKLEGKPVIASLGKCAFVPLIGSDGYMS